MTEEEFIQKLKEIGFGSHDIIGMQNNMALKVLCSILAQMGIITEKNWDPMMSDERVKTLEPYFKAKKENPGIPWEVVRKNLGL